MKIALAQMDVKPNNPRKNLEKMLEMIESAKSQNVDLIAFPEMCISGYLVGDKFTEDTYCYDMMRYNEILREASKDIAIVYGNIYVDNTTEIQKRTGSKAIHPNNDGRVRKYNAVYAFQNQKPVSRMKSKNQTEEYAKYLDSLIPQGIQPKTLLPDYRIFHDKRFFYPTIDIAINFKVDVKELLQPFIFKDKNGKNFNIGREVCEDLWCEDYRMAEEAIDVSKFLIENGAEAIINVSASPWTYGKNHARDNRISFIKSDFSDIVDKGFNFKPFYYVNAIGVQNTGKTLVTFDGSSTVYNGDAKPVMIMENSYEEGLMIIDNDNIKSMSVKERSEKYMIAEKYDAIIMGIRGLKDNYGLRDDPNFLIGLSGGKDSAVVAALLCDAVGADKVTAINMPTVYNSEITKIAAAQIAVALGINYKIMPIKKIVDAVEETIEGMDLDGTGRKLSVLNKENIQAKIRGTDMLSNIASKYGMIFSNNGNKLEVFTGYCTLYGDTNGAFSPIADLLASEVFDMARYINELHGCEIIPKILIPDRLYRFGRGQIQPTAGLKENQVDPFLWGFDDGIVERVRNYKSASIENIMEWYLDGTLEKNISTSKEIIQYRNMDNPKEFVTHLEWLFSLYQQNVFKRKFVPLTFMLSKSAFGDDYMESILLHNKTMNYGELKAKVLSMKNYYDTSSIYRLNFDINKLLA